MNEPSPKISSMEDALVFLGYQIEEAEPNASNNYADWLWGRDEEQ